MVNKLGPKRGEEYNAQGDTGLLGQTAAKVTGVPKEREREI